MGFMVLTAVWVVMYKQFQPQKPQNEGLVIQSQSITGGYRYVVKYGFYNYHLYTNEHITIGSVIQVEGTFKQYEDDQFEGDFSSLDYHKSRFVYYVIYHPKIQIIEQKWIPHLWHQNIKQHIEQLPYYTQVFVKSLVLGMLETELKTGTSKIGITHLFVLSGLHVTMLIGLTDKMLFFIPKKARVILQSSGLLLYLWITLFPVSLIRAVIQYILYETINFNQIRYTRLDVFSYTWIIMLIINPFYFDHTGFQLSFLVSFLFIVSRFKNTIQGAFTSTLSAQTFVIPITSKISQQLYPIAFFTTPLFIPLFTYVLLPLAWLSLYLPVGEILNEGFYYIILLIGFLEMNALSFRISMVVGVYALVYWGLWIYAYQSEQWIDKARRILVVIIFVLFIPYVKNFNPVGKVTFLSVGQGDTTIIERPYNQCTVVIDTFGDVVDYLKYNHIEKIDYLIITHGDYDHHRETMAIMNEIQVKQLVLSQYDDSDFQKTMRVYNPMYVQKGDRIRCGDIELNVLSPFKNYPSSNDVSVVIQTTIAGTTYLFTGDIEYDAEFDLVTQSYGELRSDILKVGHHGSRSSTHLAFLNAVNPSIAIISSGKDNSFGHPHSEVIQRLQQKAVKIYQTKEVQTICFVDLPFYRRYLILIHKPG